MRRTLRILVFLLLGAIVSQLIALALGRRDTWVAPPGGFNLVSDIMPPELEKNILPRPVHAAMSKFDWFEHMTLRESDPVMVAQALREPLGVNRSMYQCGRVFNDGAFSGSIDIVQTGFPFRSAIDAQLRWRVYPVRSRVPISELDPENVLPDSIAAVPKNTAQDVQLLGLPPLDNDFRSGEGTALPLRPLWLGLGANSIIYGFLLAVAHRSIRAFIARSRTDDGRCPKCAHILNTSTTCPECGTVVRTQRQTGQ